MRHYGEIDSSIPERLRGALAETYAIHSSFLAGLQFIVQDTGRSSDYFDNHLLSFASQDLLQSSFALPILAMEGIHNAARREIRFIIEASIKLCYIQNQEYQSPIEDKLSEFKSVLDSPSISFKNNIALDLLPEHLRQPFSEEAGRTYGETSNYVHLSSSQVMERIALLEQGRSSGKESAGDVRQLNSLFARGLALSIVYLLHSVPPYVAGDLLVNSDGTSFSWYFEQSRYIAAIDEKYDYKHERKDKLEAVQAKRARVIRF